MQEHCTGGKQAADCNPRVGKEASLEQRPSGLRWSRFVRYLETQRVKGDRGTARRIRTIYAEAIRG